MSPINLKEEAKKPEDNKEEKNIEEGKGENDVDEKKIEKVEKVEENKKKDDTIEKNDQNIEKKEQNIEKTEEKIEEKKSEDEKKKEEGGNETNNDEIKNNQEIEKKEEEGKEEEKKEEGTDNKNEIKEEEEKQEKYKSSPYCKVFNPKTSKSDFLSGVIKDINSNSYKIFIPTIYLQEFETEYKMIIYTTKGIIFFLFFDQNLEIIKQIEHIEKIPKRINKYFSEQLSSIKDLEKLPTNESNMFCYKNSYNKSLRFSGFINKKSNNFDWKLFETLQKSMFVNGDTELNSLTKYKGYYVYYIKALGQEVILIYKDNLTLTQVKQEIDKTKKAYFDNLFLY